MTIRKVALATLAVALALVVSGCEDQAVRQLAMTLRASVAEDEKLIDTEIGKQNNFYEKQQDTITDYRQREIPLKLEAARRMQSAQAATDLSLNPSEEARLAKIMTYLQVTHDKEFELWKRAVQEDQELREDLKSRITKLERKKKVLTQIKKNLDQLAVQAGSKKRAQFLLQFSRDTYAEIKKSTK
jgi:hypothetical protein